MSEPIIMIAVFLDETKQEEHHDTFFRTMQKDLKNTKNVPIVTDDEHAIVNAITSCTDLYRLGCNQHLRDDISRWVDNHHDSWNPR